MNGSWWVEEPIGTVLVTARWARPPEGAALVPPDAAAWSVDRWFPPARRDTVAALLRELQARTSDLQGPLDGAAGWSAARETLRIAFREGRLRAYRRLPVLSGSPLLRAALPPEPQAPPPDPDTHWIRVAVVDTAGKPIPFLRYEMTLPDGSVAEGNLDAEGCLALSKIPGGGCSLTLPELHATDWALA